ncbi:MAG TPA: methyltransferase domain-containing protein [Ktedonobacterales bacterium]|nr:methyltransferase domain-containing protein [Ktedonobacterales bacterium]
MQQDTPVDPKAFKAQQREQWSNVAQGWRKRWAAFEKEAQALSDRLIELAHVAPGQRVLDIATGIGEPAMTAARLVGPNGSVMAIDQAPQMLAVARERMQAAGVENVEFVEGDAEAAELPHDSFNAVVCRWGLMFFNDPTAALARFRASLVPKGWLAAAVWGQPERVPIISLPFSVFAREQGQQPPATPSGPSPFALSTPAALEQVVRDAGFANVRSEPFTVTFVFSSVDELLGYMGDVSAPIRAMMATQTPERQAELWKKLADAAAPFAEADGTIRLPNDCLIVSGQRA